MANNFLQNGLLGFGGFGLGGNNMPTNSLLGDYYDPAEMRKYQMKQMLLGLGAGLMAEKGFGKGAALALAAGDRAGTVYRDNAMDAYKIKTAQDEQAYQRGRDAKADERWQMQYDYNKDRDKRADDRLNRQDAWTNTQNQHTMDEWQRAEDQRNALQNQVTGWMDNQTQQGASLPFSPGVRSIARQGGLAGPSATEQWQFDNARPYVSAQDYSGAFQQITAQPPAPTAPKTRDYMRGDQRIYEEMQPDGTWRELGSGPAYKPTPDTTVNVNNSGEPSDSKLRAELSKKEGETWNNYQQGAASSGGMVQDLQALDELSRLAPQGPITGRLAQMFPGASSAGAVYQSVISRIAPTLRQPGSGSTSDVEYEGFLRSLPSLVNNPEANVAISGILQRKAEINIRRGEIVDKYQNGEISASEARKQLGALNRQSILDPQMKQLLAATGGGSPNVDDLVKQYTTPQQ